MRHVSEMTSTETIHRIFGRSSPTSFEVTTPKERAHVPGVLVIAGPRFPFGVTRWQQPSRKRRDVKVDSVIEACRQLLIQQFDMVIVLPGGVAAQDDVSLATLRDLANGAPVLVLSEADAALPRAAPSEELAREMASPEQSINDPDLQQTVTVGPLVGYRASGMIAVNGEPLKLSLTQSRILWRLLDAPQHQCKATELVGAMAHPGFEQALNTLRVHLTRLRQKLAAAGGDGMLVTGRAAYWLHWPPTK